MYFAISLGNLTDINNKNVFHESGNKTCDNDRCLMKCCEFGKYINKIVFEGKKDHQMKRITRCQPFNKINPTLDESFNNVFIRKPNFSSFDTKSGLFPTNASFRSNSIDITEFGFNFYLNEHAEIQVEIPNVCNRWIRVPSNMYCIDLIMVQKGTHNQRLKPGIFTMYLEVPAEKNRPTTNIMIVGMLISCFFLLLVLIVYGILPELRNLCGQILMAYVASLFGAFLTLSLMKTRSHKPLMCESLTYVIYFFFLASFFWMNVMSFDIWWTFRGYAKARQINRRGEPFKFLMYCLYAFGLPLAMTVGLAVLNKVDMTSVPWFITPKIPDAGCFMQEAEKFLYLYIPMLILILSNWIMYIMTAVNIWRLSRGTAVLNSETSGSSQARRLNRKRFIIYVKLSVVMGLNWLLELMNYTKANSAVWFISDCYNVLIGLAIFIIFVCKRKILKKLLNRFSRDKKATWYPTQEEGSKSATSTCTEFSAAQGAQPLQCYNACETKI